MASEFEFVPPPEAPVFRPTEEEFADPLGYINKIRPIAEQTGIARIVPPPDWQPPFAVDVDNLKFTPRIQRLNELEAHTRVKLNFLDQIAKFWELQGSSLRIPLVEGKALDLHALHCEVHKEGGPDVVSLNRRWNKIAHRMGFPTAKHHLSFTLKHHYDKILLPYDIFKRAQACGEAESGEAPEPAPEPRPAEDTGKKMAGGTRRVNRPQETTLDHDAVQELADQGGNNKELKRLQFYGAGPKMSGYQESVKSKAPRAKKILYEADPLARYVCHTCTKGDSEESMLLCDGCDDSYHTFCLNPPLAEIPKGDWRCPQCVAAEVEKPQEAFGFEQAQKEYTLQTFGEMADQFKADYFNMPVHMIPTQTVEREFWRVVSSIDEDVCVEYGADLHTMDHGSGFPTAQSKNLSPEDQLYVESGWNLNNIAVLDDSILAHIKANISGMKVPWMYVGMCFSTFCWHNEDHWSYSINYLHWGEPKTWYGVSGLRATQFEAAMTAAAPELFKAQPDLLHQLVTTMNPNVLMAAGVPIFRTDQHAGEFVITLPRAYHTGFNQGFNFAEAVNFAPPDWLSIGRECVAHYSQLRRFCVFSHDELVCSMALEPDRLSLLVASATYQNMLRLIETERQGRTQMLDKGVRRAEREAFELLQDDERQCDYCKTTCFLSAITCPCSKRLVCLRHYDKLCECPPANHVLRYRYTLQELPEMLNGLKVRVESFDRWIQRVKEGLEATGDDRLDLEELKALLQEAEAKRFPESDLISSLALVVEEATKCSLVAQQLTSNKVRTRTRQQGDTKHRLTVDELQLFHEHVAQLACRVPEQDDIGRLLQQVQQFQRRACQLVEPELPPPAADIQACVDMGAGLDIELPEIAELRQRLSHAEWMEEVEEAVEGRRRLSVDGLQKLVQTGVTLPPYHVVERAMSELQTIVQNGQQLEERARAALDARPVQSLPEIEALLREAEKVPATLPNIESLEEAVKKAQAWMERVVALTDKKEHPRLEVIEAMVARAQPMPVLLPDLSRLESLVNSAKTWRERTARTFLKRSSASVLDVLTPRTEHNLQQPRRKRRPKEEHPLGAGVDGEGATVAQVVDAYRAAEARELELVRELRAKNRQKRETEAADAQYCLCRQPLRGQMLQCQLCCDCFHASCVKNLGVKRESSASGGGGLKQESAPPPPDAHFLCPACQRTRRPRLEMVLSLLLTLQKLSVRMPEGIALQCLTERAMSWQDRARQLLSREDMVHNLAVLAAQREVAGREKPLGRPPGPARDRSAESSAGLEPDSDSSRDSPAIQIKREASLEHSSFSSSEHAYSSAFKPAPTTPARRPRKSILSPRHTEAPPLPPGAVLRLLAPEAVALLESVLMEGDLLEVRLEEVGQLWSLLSAARPQAAADMTFPDIDIVKMEGRKSGTVSGGGARKKRAPPGTDSPRGSQPPKRLKVKVKPAEQRGSRELGTPSPAPRSASASPSPARRTPKPAAASFKRKPAGKARKMVSDGKGRRAPKERSASQDSDGTLSNYVEDCAATPCQKPHGSCINWIGCDDCEQWYHYICVGLPKKYQVTEDMVYICPRCQDTQSGPRAASSSGLLDLAAAAEEEDGANALLSLAAGGLASAAPPSAQPPRKGRPGPPGDEPLSGDSADEE